MKNQFCAIAYFLQSPQWSLCNVHRSLSRILSYRVFLGPCSGELTRIVATAFLPENIGGSPVNGDHPRLAPCYGKAQ